jgi:lysyl-tRNA synthetase, class II
MSETDQAELTEAEVSEQKAVRLAKRERLLEEGDAYPVSLPITSTIPQIRAEYGELEADATTGVTVGLAGRVVHSRNTGKLCFAALQSGDGARIQAMVPDPGHGELRRGRPGVARPLEGTRRPRRPRVRLG